MEMEEVVAKLVKKIGEMVDKCDKPRDVVELARALVDLRDAKGK